MALFSDIVQGGKYYGSRPPITRYAYDSSGLVEYIGFAPKGTASSASAWDIAKLAYDGSSRITAKEWSISNAVWDDRSTAGYFTI